jgi:hypothetical protein
MTMARVGRLAGALLAVTGSDYFLIGNTKRPCDWSAAGFESPGALDAVERPYVRLTRAGALNVPGPWIDLGASDLAGASTNGEELARRLAQRLLIDRNGSVSDRLWRLVIRADPDGDDPPADAVVGARWLVEAPGHVWEIVRERVLKCL